MHGLERAWGKKVQFVHVDFRSPSGKALGRRYHVEHLPVLLLMDGTGQVQSKLGMGLHLREEIEAQLARLIEGRE